MVGIIHQRAIGQRMWANGGNHKRLEFLPQNTIGQKAYWLHNLRLTYRLPGGEAELTAWVRNVTDQVYKTFAFDASQFQDTTVYFVGEPRMWGLTLILNF